MVRKSEKRLILGWDVGGTASSAVVGMSEGRIVDREEWPSGVDRGPQAMVEDFLGHARRLLQVHKSIEAVGVSIGGPMNANAGVILSPPHLPGWDHVPLKENLERELRLPVVVEHDAAACLLAEVLWGAAAGCTHAAYLTCGTGFGAGVLMNGQVVYGPQGQSPELGHVRLAPDGPPMFGGKRGCAESFCSGEGIGKLASWMFPDHFPRPTDAKALGELAGKGDSHAGKVLDEAARRTGQACAILADIFAPQVIVLGSLARYFGRAWVEKVRKGFTEEALPINSRHTKITPAALGEKLQDLSAVAPCIWRNVLK
jgi:glucokinase